MVTGVNKLSWAFPRQMVRCLLQDFFITPPKTLVMIEERRVERVATISGEGDEVVFCNSYDSYLAARAGVKHVVHLETELNLNVETGMLRGQQQLGAEDDKGFTSRHINPFHIGDPDRSLERLPLSLFGQKQSLSAESFLYAILKHNHEQRDQLEIVAEPSASSIVVAGPKEKNEIITALFYLQQEIGRVAGIS